MPYNTKYIQKCPTVHTKIIRYIVRYMQRSPFADPAISVLKTMTMSTGDVGFNSIFRLDPSGNSDGKQQIQYPPLSYIIWFLFIVFMPVILVNMLVRCWYGELMYVYIGMLLLL